MILESNKMVFLRNADESDIDNLYHWRNDIETRNNSFNTEQILYNDHVKWFERTMKDTDVFQYILMNDNTPIGQVRVDIVGMKAEVSYTIAPNERKKGYGKILISLITDKIRKDIPQVKSIVGKVKPSNSRSMKCFEENGFTETYRVYEIDI